MTAATTEQARRARGSDTSGRSRTELRELVRAVGAELELAPAEDIVEWAVATFGHRFCVTSSMGDAVLAHLVSRVAPGVDVVFLDTGYHFAETIGTRDAVAATLPLRVVNVEPELTVQEQDERHGPRLYERDPDLCCSLRKVAPLNDALAGMDAWISGLRREQSPSRANTPKFAWDAKHGLWKANPIADWTERDVWTYILEHDLPYNPLHDRGYSSIGCTHCTKPGTGRDGRWSGTSKTECGLHA